MNHKDLLEFRDQVAFPAMKSLFERTEIPEGFCCINDLKISFLDGRSCGVDNVIEASGLAFRNGKVEKYSFYETDIEFTDFAEQHKDCVFLTDGKLKLINELREFEISTVMRNFEFCAYFLPEMSAESPLSFAGIGSEAGIKFEKMKYLFASDDYLGLDQDADSISASGNSQFIFDEELAGCEQDGKFTIEGYLWATDALVERMKQEVRDKHSAHEIESFDNINFYVIYNPMDSCIDLVGSYYFFDAQGEEQGQFSIPLTAEEKYVLVQNMESHCRARHDLSLQEFAEEFSFSLDSYEDAISFLCEKLNERLDESTIETTPNLLSSNDFIPLFKSTNYIGLYCYCSEHGHEGPNEYYLVDRHTGENTLVLGDSFAFIGKNTLDCLKNEKIEHVGNKEFLGYLIQFSMDNAKGVIPEKDLAGIAVLEAALRAENEKAGMYYRHPSLAERIQNASNRADKSDAGTNRSHDIDPLR